MVSLGLVAALVGVAVHTHASAMTTTTPEIMTEACIKNAEGATTKVTRAHCSSKVTTVGVTLDSAQPLPESFEVGTHKLVWTGKDASGRPVSKTQTLIVRDLTAPILPPLEHMTVDVTPHLVDELSPSTPFTITVVDNVSVGEEITVEYDSSCWPPVKTKSYTESSICTIVWNATDGASLSSLATQKVTLTDMTGPTLTCPSDVRIKSAEPVTVTSVPLGKPTVHDVVDGSITTATNNSATAATNGKFPVGVTSVVWTAEDSNGNDGTCIQSVYVLPASREEILPDAGVTGTRFGSSLASYGPLLFVGDEHDSTRAANSGAVRVYNTKSIITAVPTIYHGTAANQYFGTSLAVFGSSNNLLAVGAKGYNVNEGAVFVYDAATRALRHTITNPNTMTTTSGDSMVTVVGKDQFGASLAAMGDKLVIGAPMYKEGTKIALGKAYVFDSSGTKLYEIPNPTPAARDQFGVRVAAHDDGTTETAYVSSRADGTTKGVVYKYDVTATTSDSAVPTPTKLLSGSTTRTLFGEEQVRVGGDGHLYVGEPRPSTTPGTAGKIHRYAATGAASSSVSSPACCNAGFGTAFDLDGRLLYAGNVWVRGGGTLTAFDPTKLAHRDSFVNKAAPPTGYEVTHFGFAVESLPEGRVAVSEYLENPTTSEEMTRVHILDLRGLDPTPPHPQPPSPAPSSPPGTSQAPSIPIDDSGSSNAASAAPVTTPIVPKIRVEPALTSTQYVSPDKIKLTYGVTIEPFVVDISDFVMVDVGLEVVSADVNGSVITLTYAGSPSSGTPNATPGVELIGDIGYY